MTDTLNRGVRKSREGVVVSEGMDKTRIVRVSRRVRHPLYGKEISRSKKYYVHDEQNETHVGDTVRIEESRPISRLKRWRLVAVVARAAGVAKVEN